MSCGGNLLLAPHDMSVKKVQDIDVVCIYRHSALGLGVGGGEFHYLGTEENNPRTKSHVAELREERTAERIH